MNYNTEIFEKDFKIFLKCLDNLKTESEIKIHNGYVNIETNEKMLVVNFNSLAGALNLNILDVKDVVKSLKIFNNNTDVKLRVRDDYYEFEDDYSKLRFYCKQPDVQLEENII